LLFHTVAFQDHFEFFLFENTKILQLFFLISIPG